MRAVPLGLLCLLAAAVVPAASPVLKTVSCDGFMEDWAVLLDSPPNTTFDGVGHMDCTTSIDRDCRLSNNGVDLSRFSWTYDAENLYVFFERYAATGSLDHFYLHLDLDNDGRVGAGADRVAEFQLKATSQEVTVLVHQYAPLDPGGDPLTDPSGFADGWRMPGGLGALLATRGPFPWATPDRERFEARVSWADLGLPGPVALGFHAGLDDGSGGPGGTADNLGGPDDGAGTTGFFEHSLHPPRHGGATVGGTIRYAHTLRNAGNLADTYAFRTTSSSGCSLTLWTDPDRDGDPADGVALGFDVNGDGDYGDSLDRVYSDTDADGLPDSGPMAPGERLDLVLEILASRVNKTGTDRSRVRATSTRSGNLAEVEDRTSIGGIGILPNLRVVAAAGTTVSLAHEILNNLGQSTCIDLRCASARGWTCVLWSDPDGDGDPSDGVPLFNACGGADPDVTIRASEVMGIVARVAVPPGEALGSEDTVTISGEANASGSFSAQVTDVVAVGEILGITPPYRLADGTGKSAPLGRPLYFRHALTWAGPEPDSFLLTAVPPPGGAAVVLTDPDGDGRPGDGQIIPPGGSTGLLPAGGGRFCFLVRLDLPPGVTPGTVIQLGVSAVSESSPGLSASVVDEAIVTQIAVFADDGYLVQENVYPTCGEIHALATGLLAYQQGRYRMRWVREPGGVAERTSAISSDEAGEASDTLAVDGTTPEGAWSARLEEYNGTQWSEIARDDFVIAAFGRLRALTTGKTVYKMIGEALSVWAVVENTGPTAISGAQVRFLVLDPTGTLVLRAAGDFIPEGQGNWTWTALPFDLAPGEIRDEAFTIEPVEFPVPGDYTVSAQVDTVCGNTMSALGTILVVDEDTDGDGWSDALEIRVGTDPFDRDTDDDGLLDPADGDGDADADGAIDALECDADGDSLPDGLESGLGNAGLDPDTDRGAGCFRADADSGATVTDRLDPDTDGGGLPDGAEDADGNGERGAAEKDPLEPSDDPCSTNAPPEVPWLHLRKGAGGAVVLWWADLRSLDPCMTYRVFIVTDAFPGDIGNYVVQAGAFPEPVFVHEGALRDGKMHCYLVAAAGPFSGEGPVGVSGR